MSWIPIPGRLVRTEASTSTTRSDSRRTRFYLDEINAFCPSPPDAASDDRRDGARRSADRREGGAGAGLAGSDVWVYMCGPPPMMTALAKGFLALGVSRQPACAGSSSTFADGSGWNEALDEVEGRCRQRRANRRRWSNACPRFRDLGDLGRISRSGSASCTKRSPSPTGRCESLLSRDDQERSPIRIPAIDLRVGPRVEVGDGQPGKPGALGAGNREGSRTTPSPLSRRPRSRMQSENWSYVSDTARPPVRWIPKHRPRRLQRRERQREHAPEGRRVDRHRRRGRDPGRRSFCASRPPNECPITTGLRWS